MNLIGDFLPTFCFLPHQIVHQYSTVHSSLLTIQTQKFFFFFTLLPLVRASPRWFMTSLGWKFRFERTSKILGRSWLLLLLLISQLASEWMPSQKSSVDFCQHQRAHVVFSQIIQLDNLISFFYTWSTTIWTAQNTSLRPTFVQTTTTTTLRFNHF